MASDESNKAYSGDSASIVVGSSEAYKKRVTENLGLLGLPIEESREDYNLPHVCVCLMSMILCMPRENS